MEDKPDGVHARMEKYLLRKAFDVADHPYLPESVLWRQKEQFSDGVGYDWVDGLRAYAQQVEPSSFQHSHGPWSHSQSCEQQECICNCVVQQVNQGTWHCAHAALHSCQKRKWVMVHSDPDRSQIVDGGIVSSSQHRSFIPKPARTCSCREQAVGHQCITYPTQMCRLRLA